MCDSRSKHRPYKFAKISDCSINLVYTMKYATSKMRQVFRNKVKKPAMVSKDMSKIRHDLQKGRHNIKNML